MRSNWQSNPESKGEIGLHWLNLIRFYTLGNCSDLNPLDRDGDLVPDFADNCPPVANVGQLTNPTDGGALSSQPSSVAVACACLCGDVDRNCQVDLDDRDEIFAHSGFMPPLTNFDEDYCDINRDGACNLLDGIAVHQWFAGEPVQTQVVFGEPSLCAPLP